ncbi:MAG: P-type DNA transfer protein VirB5 [Proteobacteria bacterium]|nr:MAG: P-type DNA transfer protein VirB5 [Pseudomonadota bacterium]
MKRIIRALLVLVAIACGTHANAQIPVTDLGSIAQQVQQVAAWGKQFAQMQTQYNQLQSTYNSLSGIRGMANLVNNPALRNYLPTEYQDMLSGTGMPPGLSGNISSIRDSARILGIQSTALDMASDTARGMQNMQNQNALNRAIGEEGYRQAASRFSSIQVLLDKVNATPDQKDILDLQGRIQAEQVMLQNEQSKLQMMTYLAGVQKDIAQQQAREISIKSAQGGIPRF